MDTTNLDLYESMKEALEAGAKEENLVEVNATQEQKEMLEATIAKLKAKADALEDAQGI